VPYSPVALGARSVTAVQAAVPFYGLHALFDAVLQTRAEQPHRLPRFDAYAAAAALVLGGGEDTRRGQAGADPSVSVAGVVPPQHRWPVPWPLSSVDTRAVTVGAAESSPNRPGVGHVALESRIGGEFGILSCAPLPRTLHVAPIPLSLPSLRNADVGATSKSLREADAQEGPQWGVSQSRSQPRPLHATKDALSIIPDESQYHNGSWSRNPTRCVTRDGRPTTAERIHRTHNRLRRELDDVKQLQTIRAGGHGSHAMDTHCVKRGRSAAAASLAAAAAPSSADPARGSFLAAHGLVPSAPASREGGALVLPPIHRVGVAAAGAGPAGVPERQRLVSSLIR
jgi:hypothetical protein